MATGVMGDPVRPGAWLATAWTVPVVAAVPIALAWEARGRLDLEHAVALTEVVLAGMTLAVVLALYLRWRVTRAPAVAWVTAVLVAATLGDLAPAVTTSANERAAERPGWMLLVDVACIAALAGLVLVRRHRAPGLDPAVLGVVLGAVSATAHLLPLLARPLLPGSPLLISVTGVATVLVHAAFVLVLLHLGLPAPLPRALVHVTLLLAVGAVVTVSIAVWYPGSAPGTWVGALVGVLLAGTALPLLHATVLDTTRTVAGLKDRVHEIEADVAADRERLHEINATVAGIATASRLMHDHDDLSASHKERLDELLTAEILRLERLAEGRVGPASDVSLDETVERLVLAQRAMGRDVRWRPCGLAVRAPADELAEILTTLLTNAAEHAPGSPVTVGARKVADTVEVTVADQGPGVAHEMVERVFQRGERGHDSHGQGIGLFVARRISEHLGGSLFVLPAQAGSRRGAVFVLALPQTRSARGTASATTP